MFSGWRHPEIGRPVFQPYYVSSSVYPTESLPSTDGLSSARRRQAPPDVTLLHELLQAGMQGCESEAFHSQACMTGLMQILGSLWALSELQVCGDKRDFWGRYTKLQGWKKSGEPLA